MFDWLKKNKSGRPVEKSGADAGASVVVTIDGPSGSGKGTISRRVAEALGFNLLDSGALYRLVALAAEDACLSVRNTEALVELARHLDVRFDSDEGGEEKVWLGEQDVTKSLRSEETGASASIVAQLEPVREALIERQRAFRQPPGLVADGRDMGTRIFPDAALKIYMTASAEERAKRRHKQLKEKGLNVSLAALSRDIEKRDRRDSERTIAPLRPAMDAKLLDTTGQSIEAVTQQVLDWVAEL
ncbi:MAG: (d)CMP kinase [Gammaproteobacteria bacterium]|nr:(d)CMP kinase [Gammaproteobacteria bacterium]MBT8105195.1 (d)CMP kinase [Gammaproteobacteria bacterium]NNF50061.1 (d)CMP kinase [Woeseiaceae bacterium]NNK25209.1 (d)CMP kinase [Woeseiaceae bacterium]